MFVCCQEDRFWTRQHPILAFQVLSFGVCHDARARHRDVPRRLQHIRHSLTSESATTLVHAFVTSHVNYCNVVFAGAPKIITNKLQRVLNSAACVFSGTWKFDRGLRQLMHTELHWLDIPERVKYKLGVITGRCLYSSAPRYQLRSSLDNCL